jgi:hypothetical protein
MSANLKNDSENIYSTYCALTPQQASKLTGLDVPKVETTLQGKLVDTLIPETLEVVYCSRARKLGSVRLPCVFCPRPCQYNIDKRAHTKL